MLMFLLGPARVAKMPTEYVTVSRRPTEVRVENLLLLSQQRLASVLLVTEKSCTACIAASAGSLIDSDLRTGDMAMATQPSQ